MKLKFFTIIVAGNARQTMRFKLHATPPKLFDTTFNLIIFDQICLCARGKLIILSKQRFNKLSSHIIISRRTKIFRQLRRQTAK